MQWHVAPRRQPAEADVLSRLRRTALLGLVAAGSTVAPLTIAATSTASETARYRRLLRLVLTLRNPTSRVLNRQTYWGRIPLAASAAQRMVAVDVSTPFSVHEGPLHHRVVELSFDGVAPFAHKTASISIELEMLTRAQPERLEAGRPWLSAEQFIESTAPAVVALARSLAGGTHLTTARSIYEWVANHVVYAGYLPEELGAAHALEHRRGDCTEYADLCVALARASGIPARKVSGFVIDRHAVPKAADYHDWAEFYIGDTWCLVDAQKRCWVSPREQYVAFEVHGASGGALVPAGSRYRIAGDIEVVQ